MMARLYVIYKLRNYNKSIGTILQFVEIIYLKVHVLKVIVLWVTITQYQIS